MYIRFIKWLARFMTSPFFVAFFFNLIGFWIAFNTLVPPRLRFDPAPFMALNLVMSALAGIQATATSVAQRDIEKYIIHMLEAILALLKAEMERQQKGGGSNAEGQADSGDGRPELPMGDAP